MGLSARVAILLFSLGLMRPAQALPAYSITELPPLPGGELSAALAVNSSGIVVGWSRIVSYDLITRPCLWRAGVPQALPTIGQPARGRAYDINDSEVIVGYDGTGTIAVAVKWENGAVVPLDVQPVSSDAFGINNAGLIVGSIDNSSGYRRAVAWRDGVRTGLGTAKASETVGEAVAVNALGWIAGYTQWDGACQWTDQGFSDLPPTVFRAGNAARAINDEGMVVGWERAGPLRACLWRQGVATILAPLPGHDGSRADSVDNYGNVVGESWINLPPGRAVLWRDGRIIDLNSLLPANSGWELTDATHINEAGYIVGLGVHNGRQVGFMLKPRINDMFWARRALYVAAGLDRATPREIPLLDVVPDGAINVADAIRLARHAAFLER